MLHNPNWDGYVILYLQKNYTTLSNVHSIYIENRNRLDQVTRNLATPYIISYTCFQVSIRTIRLKELYVANWGGGGRNMEKLLGVISQGVQRALVMW